MKKLFMALTALALALLLALSALAEGLPIDGTLKMYANKKKVKIFTDHDAESDVIKKVKGGTELLLERMTEDGEWYGTLVEDPDSDGQIMGWVRASDLLDTMPQDFCKHEWRKWTVEEEPTCTEDGFRYRTCKICGLREEEVIEKEGHDFTRWKVTKEATCYDEGIRTHTCLVCDYVETEEFLEPHTFGAWSVSKEPTCREEGRRTRTCLVCGATESEPIDKLPHAYETRVTVEATDHSSGIRAKICKNCGKNGGEESFDPEGTLRRNDKGEDVRAVQQMLVDQGYLRAGGADGVFGAGTERAVIQFQTDQGLTPDGVVWPQTRKRLNHVFGPWTVVKEMTRSEPGERVRVCKDCGYMERETVESGTVIEKGARGEHVRLLQQILNRLGYETGIFDGVYGRKLDAAMAGFAADRGLTVEEGKVRPADVDALVNAWFASVPDETWKGVGNAASPVKLTLTVTPAGDADDTGIRTYNWTLTNQGSEKATFNALLLNFGTAPNFRQNNLAMAIDSFQLKANGANSLKGTVSVSDDWGEGNLNFAAMGVSDATGALWLSNAVAFPGAAE